MAFSPDTLSYPARTLFELAVARGDENQAGSGVSCPDGGLLPVLPWIEIVL